MSILKCLNYVNKTKVEKIEKSGQWKIYKIHKETKKHTRDLVTFNFEELTFLINRIVV
jgi:hypothetical protein